MVTDAPTCQTAAVATTVHRRKNCMRKFVRVAQWIALYLMFGVLLALIDALLLPTIDGSLVFSVATIVAASLATWEYGRRPCDCERA